MNCLPIAMETIPATATTTATDVIITLFPAVSVCIEEKTDTKCTITY